MRLFNKTIVLVLFSVLMSGRYSLSAQSAAADRDTLIITKLRLNTKHSEYSPFLFGKKMYFVSNRPTDVGVVVWDQNFAVPSKLFEAEKKDSLRFSRLHPADVLNETLNAGPLTISKTGVYYTSISKLLSKKTDFETPLRIFYAAFNSDSTLQKPIEIDFGVSDSVTLCHPAVLNDSVLYFTYYDRNSTTATDIYYSYKKDGVWSFPTKCVSPINSDKNEEFPYILNNQLFFSSNRAEGKGGLDIYVVALNTGKALVNLEEINSGKDDFGIVYVDQKSGYFSSNRGGNDDIYYFNRSNRPTFENCIKQIENTYCYTLKEKDSFESNDTLNMFYEWTLGDGTKAKGLVVNHCYPGEGVYKVELNVIEKKSGETFLNELSYDLKIENEKQLYIFSFDTVASGSTVDFSATYSNIENFKIEKYFWNFGTSKHYEGIEQKYFFKKAGKYEIKLVAEGFLNGIKTSICSYKEITVMDDFVIKADAVKKRPLYYSFTR